MDDAEEIFEELWQTFSNRYPFFELRNVDWNKQYQIYRPLVKSNTDECELFDIFCKTLAPLNDGHVELIAKAKGNQKKRYFNPESKPRFWREVTKLERKRLFKTTEKNLVARHSLTLTSRAAAHQQDGHTARTMCARLLASECGQGEQRLRLQLP